MSRPNPNGGPTSAKAIFVLVTLVIIGWYLKKTKPSVEIQKSTEVNTSIQK